MTDKSVEKIMDGLVKIVLMMYNLILLGGTAYLVQEHNWSMWSFLLAGFFFLLPTKKYGQKDSTENSTAT